jgi:hypothetical protein
VRKFRDEVRAKREAAVIVMHGRQVGKLVLPPMEPEEPYNFLEG